MKRNLRIFPGALFASIVSVLTVTGVGWCSIVPHREGETSAIEAPLTQALPGETPSDRLGGHTEAVTSVSFSPDGKTIASASLDGTVKLWNTEGKLLHTLQSHTSGVSSVSFSPDGKMFASVSSDKTVKLWNTEGKLLKTLQSHTLPVRSVSFSPDGHTIASASDDGTVKLWNLEGQLLHTLLVPPEE